MMHTVNPSDSIFIVLQITSMTELLIINWIDVKCIIMENKDCKGLAF